MMYRDGAVAFATDLTVERWDGKDRQPTACCCAEFNDRVTPGRCR
jgi:hypothetical protein